MHLFRRVVACIAAGGFVLCCGAVLLFNRPTLGWQLLSVPTGSMRPTFDPGSVVLTHQVSVRTLKVGDIITYTNPMTMRSTLTHRIVRAYKLSSGIPAYITKGDANPSPDPPVVAGLVQGKVVAEVPYVGSALLWAKTWVGISVLVYLPALIVMVGETRRLAVYLRRMRPYYMDGWSRSGRSAAPVKASGVACVSVLLAGVGWQTAYALSVPGNAVALLPNTLTAKVVSTPTSPRPSLPSPAPSTSTSIPSSPPAPQVTCNTNVHMHDVLNRAESAGAAASTGGGSATSGSASSDATTNANVSATGC